MIFLTVGTQFPFDRLIKAVDEAVGCDGEEVFAQIGMSSYEPLNFRAVVSLDKDQFDRYFREASGIIGHAGMGTISLALEWNKPLLVLPRRKKYGEVVNDHQVGIAQKFEELGHLLAAYEAEDLRKKMRGLSQFVPRSRQTQSEAVAGRIAAFLREVPQIG